MIWMAALNSVCMDVLRTGRLVGETLIKCKWYCSHNVSVFVSYINLTSLFLLCYKTAILVYPSTDVVLPGLALQDGDKLTVDMQTLSPLQMTRDLHNVSSNVPGSLSSMIVSI